MVDNPTPYYYTFGRLEVTAAGGTEALQAKAMAPPFAQQAYDLKQLRSANGLQLTYTTINDYGVATSAVQTPLSLRP
ncbi:putative chaperone protein EcpD [compost metagenome]